MGRHACRSRCEEGFFWMRSRHAPSCNEGRIREGITTCARCQRGQPGRRSCCCQREQLDDDRADGCECWCQSVRSGLAVARVRASMPARSYPGSTSRDRGRAVVRGEPDGCANLVGFIQQDRWSDGGAHGLRRWSRTMAARRWARAGSPSSAAVPARGPVNRGDYERASDPWLSFSARRTAGLHAISLSTDRSTARNAVLASHSDDGGHTWSEPDVLRADNSRSGPLANLFNDKESITADPTDSDYVYAVWDRIASPNDNPLTPPQAYANAPCFHGPAWFARSTDNGATWEAAHRSSRPRRRAPRRLRTRSLCCPTARWSTASTTSSGRRTPMASAATTSPCIFSDDQGETWGDPTLVAKWATAACATRSPSPVPGGSAGGRGVLLVRTGDITPDSPWTTRTRQRGTCMPSGSRTPSARQRMGVRSTTRSCWRARQTGGQTGRPGERESDAAERYNRQAFTRR